MALVYGDDLPRGKFSGTPIHLWETGAVMGAWQKHLENRYYLKFLYMKGTTSEKIQASKELDICDRKIAFWERHPAFDKSQAAKVNTQAKKTWGL